VQVQQELANQPRCVMDGDLGPYDVLPVRLSAADTVLLVEDGLPCEVSGAGAICLVYSAAN
jgi:hypothetical protein